MNKFLRAGAMPVMAIAMLLGLGDSSSALAQVQATLPVVQSAISTPLTQPIFPAKIFTLPPKPAALPLAALVDAQASGPSLDEQAKCLATAVYFESMGESLEGQLAVAQVVINRADSGRYPTSWCGVVKQKAQFSFVRAGRFPRIDTGCLAWRKAQAIARIAAGKMAEVLPSDVLWYHADYVAPSWGRRLARVEKIGAHIFYRA
ncbi:MAG: cell wall hydrolase [Sphingomonas bacterium]|nr:cell wall hydrolase [Sphingomonas bacterium]